MLCTFLGNAVTTIKSNDKVKVFTVRGTSFEPAPLDGGGAAQENGTS
jgi:electron transfer flavoprotein alpha subunit